MIFTTLDIEKISNLLIGGNIGILPTDTIYGIHALAFDWSLFEKVSNIKNRSSDMPFITLLSKKEQLKEIKDLSDFEKECVEKYWPGPNTLIFDTVYGPLSFRVADNEFLQKILSKTGPLISTSANKHNMPPATNVNDAISYFGDEVDFYVDGNTLNNPPSSIYKISDDKIVKIR